MHVSSVSDRILAFPRNCGVLGMGSQNEGSALTVLMPVHVLICMLYNIILYK